MPLLAVHDAAAAVGASATIAAAILAWAAGYPDVASLAMAVEAAKAARATLRTDDAALSLATVHGTKGLEWDHVACVGFDEDRFPSVRTLTDSPDPRRALEEERRLAYVAWTRARRSLTIVYDPFAPSIFLREAFDPDELALPASCGRRPRATSRPPPSSAGAPSAGRSSSRPTRAAA